VGLEVRRAYLNYQAANEKLNAANAQVRSAVQALSASEKRYQAGAATLVEVTQARAAQVQAQSAQVAARYDLVFQRTLISYYAGDLDAQHVTLT
jgi:outer membrane protein